MSEEVNDVLGELDALALITFLPAIKAKWVESNISHTSASLLLSHKKFNKSTLYIEHFVRGTVCGTEFNMYLLEIFIEVFNFQC